MSSNSDILRRAVELHEERVSPAEPFDWARDKAGMHLWSKQREITESVRDNKKTAVQSGHGTGKSAVAALIASWWVDIHPPGEAFVVTTAPSAPQVHAILWEYMRGIHKDGGLPGRITLADNWTIGNRLVGYGRKPQDYSTSTFQGIHRKYVLVILDEAGGIPKWLWTAADALTTGTHCRILAIGNPDNPSSEFATVCGPKSNWSKIKISVFDSPNFTGEEVSQELKDQLTSEEWVEDKRTAWTEDNPLWVSKVLGEFPQLDDYSVIPLSWVKQAQQRWIDRDVEMDPPASTIGVDVARFGSDASCLATKAGDTIVSVEEFRKFDTEQLADLVLTRLPNDATAVVDVIGIGSGVVDKLKRMRVKVYSFNAAARTSMVDSTGEIGFPTIRSAAWWSLREKLDPSRNPTLALPDDDQLAADLIAPRWGNVVGGKIYVESKDDIRKRLGRSTDFGDAVVQALWISGASDGTIDESTFYWSDREVAGGAIAWEGMDEW